MSRRPHALPRLAFSLALLALGGACGGRPAARPGSTDGGGDRDGGDASPLGGGDAPADLSAEGSASDAALDGSRKGALDGGDAPAHDADAGPDGPDARPPIRVLSIVEGNGHACALLEDHRVKCWGANSFGQLGLGDVNARGGSPADMGDALPAVDLGTGRTAVALACARYSSCAILDDGSVKCWGLGGFTGLPGLPEHANVGDAPGEMGDHLPALNLGANRKAVLIGAGQYDTCAVLDDASVRCWGVSSDSAITSPLPTPVPLSGTVRALVGSSTGVLALLEGGELRGPLPATTARAMILPAGKTAVVAAGCEGRECALLTDGAVTCGPFVSSPTSLPPGLAGFSVTLLSGFCGLLGDGSVQCTNTLGPDFGCPLNRGPDAAVRLPLGRRAIALASGDALATCALLEGGAVRCWGTNVGGDALLSAGVTPNPPNDCSGWHDIDLGRRP